MNSDMHMNMTSQQIVAVSKEHSAPALHLAFNVKMSSWITLAFDRSEIEALSPGSSALREKVSVGVAQALRRQIEEMSDSDLNLLFDSVDIKEVRDDSDRVLLDEGGIERNATELCAAHGIEIVEIEGSVCRYIWRDRDRRFAPKDFETTSEAAIDAIEVHNLASDQVGSEAGRRALALCEANGVEIFNAPPERRGVVKFAWRSADDGENGPYESAHAAAFGAIEELGLAEPAREVSRG